MDEQIIQSEANPISQEPASELPRWFKVLLRVWAAFHVVIFVATGLSVLIAFFAGGNSFLNIVAQIGWNAITIGLIVFTLAALVFVALEIVVYIGLYQLKKWALFTVPIRIFYDVILLSFAFLFTTPSFGEIYLSVIFVVIWLLVLSFAFTNRRAFKGSGRNLLIQVPYLLVYLSVGSFWSLSFIFPDLPAAQDEDIYVIDVVLPAEKENAQLFLPSLPEKDSLERTAVDEALEAQKKLLTHEDVTDAELVRLVGITQGYTDAFLEASKKDYYMCPTVLNNYGPETILCPLNDLRDMAQLTSLRSLNQARMGEVDEAVETTELLLQFGQLMHDAPQQTLIDYLVGIAVKKIGLDTLERIVETEELGTTTAEQLAAALPLYTEETKAFEKAIRNEYMTHMVSIEQVTTPLVGKQNFYFQPNRAKSDMAEFARRHLAVARIPCGEQKEAMQELEAWVDTESLISYWKLPFTRNAYHEVIKSFILSSLGGAVLKSCELDEQNERIREKLRNTVE